MRPIVENISKKPEPVETDFYADTMEHETKNQPFKDINCSKGIYTNKFEDGLNREQGIFEKTALFITK